MKLAIIAGLITGFGIIQGCSSPQNSLPPVPQQKALPADQQNDNSDLIEQLKAEREDSAKRAEQIEAEIARLQDELATAQELSQEEKAALERQLEEAQVARDEEAAKLEELQDQLADIEKNLEEAQAENERLQEELEESQNNNNNTGDTNNNNTNNQVMKNLAFSFETDCIDVVNASQNSQANVIAYPCNFNENQQFDVEFVDNTWFRLVANHSRQCLYVEGASTANGANIQQLTCRRNGDGSELFRFFDVMGQYDFKVQNQRSGKCFKIEAEGNLVQDDCATRFTYFRMRATQ